MPIADFRTYCEMLDRARTNGFAYPAINVTSLTTANAVLRGLAESRSDGIIQVSTGGAAFASGTAVKDMALGAISIAEHVHRTAARYPVYIALHTDHCQADKLESFVLPLVAETERRRACGLPNLFNSHMFDGSALPLKDNLEIAVKLLERFKQSELILEIEAGVVGGEEDGMKAEASAKLYTTPEDTLEVARRLNGIGGRYHPPPPPPPPLLLHFHPPLLPPLHPLPPSPLYSSSSFPFLPSPPSPPPLPLTSVAFLLAATFGNVHGVYKPGSVKLKPTILKDCQEAVARRYGTGSCFHLVFHGGSGSELHEIREAIDYGVVKMNIDTDTQYAFTRSIADHMLKHYDGVLQGG